MSEFFRNIDQGYPFESGSVIDGVKNVIYDLRNFGKKTELYEPMNITIDERTRASMSPLGVQLLDEYYGSVRPGEVVHIRASGSEQ